MEAQQLKQSDRPFIKPKERKNSKIAEKLLSFLFFSRLPSFSFFLSSYHIISSSLKPPLPNTW
jgi:hypothetical protein